MVTKNYNTKGKTEEEKKLKKKHILTFFIIACLVQILLILIKPFGLEVGQTVILFSTIVAIICWITGILDKSIASILLITIYLAFKTPYTVVFSFPLSENFILIVFSFIFSNGISNSGILEKLVPILVNRCNSVKKIISYMLLVIFASVFIIPQPFSRIIIISLVFSSFFDKLNIDGKEKETLIFAIYSFSIVINTMLIRGDLILNNALLTVGNVKMTESVWIKYMFLPGMVLLFFTVCLYFIVFKKDLKKIKIMNVGEEFIRLNKIELRNLIFILFVILMWATEGFHGIKGTFIVVVASFLMVPLRMIDVKRDLKSVNINLLVFLTAAFSIGGTIKSSGIATTIFTPFTQYFSNEFSIKNMIIIFLVSVILHMVLGSNVTTLSVVVPLILSVFNIGQTEIILFTIYIGVCTHYVLPFHSVILLIGEGNGYFTGKNVIKFGIPLTVLIFAGIFTIYYGWWKIIGLM